MQHPRAPGNCIFPGRRSRSFIHQRGRAVKVDDGVFAVAKEKGRKRREMLAVFH